MTTLNPIQIVPLTQLDDGTIMITDTGVPLETVIARHNLGETPMEIHEGYPTIDLAVVHLVIAYTYHTEPNVTPTLSSSAKGRKRREQD